MKIKGTEVTSRSVEIEVRESDVLKEIQILAYRAVGMKPHYFLNRRGNLAYDEDYYHGSISEVEVGTPTKEQHDVIMAVSLLKDILNRKSL
jgi:hypothetical protein